MSKCPFCWKIITLPDGRIDATAYNAKTKEIMAQKIYRNEEEMRKEWIVQNYTGVCQYPYPPEINNRDICKQEINQDNQFLQKLNLPTTVGTGTQQIVSQPLQTGRPE